MCSKCADTGILGWSDITINFDDESTVAIRRPELCRCSKGMELFIKQNKDIIRFVHSKKDGYVEGPIKDN